MIIEKLMLDKNMVKYKIRIDHQRLWSGPVIELFFLFDGRVFRFLIGVGAGNVSVVRAYIAAATTVRERTSAMANVSAFQALGIILGPVFGLAFSPLQYPGLSIPAIKFSFNIYTGPGYLGAFLGIINIGLLFLFKEIRLFNKRGERINLAINRNPGVVLSLQDSPNKDPLPGYDKIGAIACIFFFFSIFAVFTVFETITTPLSMDEFAWSGQEATIYNNIVFFAGTRYNRHLRFYCHKAFESLHTRENSVRIRYYVIEHFVISLHSSPGRTPSDQI